MARSGSSTSVQPDTATITLLEQEGIFAHAIGVAPQRISLVPGTGPVSIYGLVLGDQPRVHQETEEALHNG